jgi:hypothetical protein
LENTVVAHRRRLAATTAAIAAVLCIGATVAVAQQDDAAPPASGDEALLERLDALEDTLPVEVAPTAVTVEQDETWGSFDGDVTGAAATLSTLETELRELYVDADDADTPVADAVADVARGWLDLHQGLEDLAVWESHDLAFPIDASDDDDVATAADELRGRAEAGLRLVLTARERHLHGYVGLREAGAAEPDAQARFDTRAADAEVFHADVRPLVHDLLSLATTAVVVPVDRFETDAPGVDARARSLTVACVDREAYLGSDDAEPIEGADDPATDDLEAKLAALDDQGLTLCPELGDEAAAED